MDARRYLSLSLIVLLCAATACYRWDHPGMELKIETAHPPVDPTPLPSESLPDRSNAYAVGTEDVLFVSVSDHPEFSGEVTVDKHGKFDMPYLADSHGTRVHAEGRDLNQITQTVQQIISPFVLDQPAVAVRLARSNSKYYVVLGYVGRQGRFNMGDKAVRLREALMRSGLFDEGADAANVHIITPDKTDPTYVVVNGWDILTGMTQQNITLKQDDIVFVPPTGWQMVSEALGEFTRRTAAIREGDGDYDFWRTESFLDASE